MHFKDFYAECFFVANQRTILYFIYYSASTLFKGLKFNLPKNRLHL